MTHAHNSPTRIRKPFTQSSTGEIIVESEQFQKTFRSGLVDVGAIRTVLTQRPLPII